MAVAWVPVEATVNSSENTVSAQFPVRVGEGRQALSDGGLCVNQCVSCQPAAGLKSSYRISQQTRVERWVEEDDIEGFTRGLTGLEPGQGVTVSDHYRVGLQGRAMLL